jgi:hypothetical protein
MKFKMIFRKPWVVSLLTAKLGLGIWMTISAVSGNTEAWDSGMFFYVGIPLMFVVSALAGYVAPKYYWLFGITTVILQPIVMFSSGHIGPLAIVGLLLFVFIAVLCTLAAYLGTVVKRKSSPTQSDIRYGDKKKV